METAMANGDEAAAAAVEAAIAPQNSNIAKSSSPKATNDEDGFDDFLSFLKTPSDTPTAAAAPEDNNKSTVNSQENPQGSLVVRQTATSSNNTQQEPNIMCATKETSTEPVKRSGCEAVGDKVDQSISGFFYSIGNFCSFRPKTTIAVSMLIAIACAGGMVKLNTENRPEKVRVV